jgi:DNA invertase Pin-like site-specific DNA recombinase
MTPINPANENLAPGSPAHRRRGRPAKPIDLGRVSELRAIGMSVRQIARVMEVSKSGIGTALQRLSETIGNVSKNSLE